MIYLYKRKSIFDKFKLVGKYDSFNDAKGIITVNISNGYDVIMTTNKLEDIKNKL